MTLAANSSLRDLRIDLDDNFPFPLFLPFQSFLFNRVAEKIISTSTLRNLTICKIFPIRHTCAFKKRKEKCIKYKKREKFFSNNLIRVSSLPRRIDNPSFPRVTSAASLENTLQTCLPSQRYEKNRPATREKKQLLFRTLFSPLFTQVSPLPRQYIRIIPIPRRIFSRVKPVAISLALRYPRSSSLVWRAGKRIREEMIALSPFFVVSPEAARAPNILFGQATIHLANNAHTVRLLAG